MGQLPLIPWIILKFNLLKKTIILIILIISTISGMFGFLGKPHFNEVDFNKYPSTDISNKQVKMKLYLPDPENVYTEPPGLTGRV